MILVRILIRFLALACFFLALRIGIPQKNGDEIEQVLAMACIAASAFFFSLNPFIEKLVREFEEEAK